MRAIRTPAADLRLRSPEIGDEQCSRCAAIITRKTERVGCMARVGVSRVGSRRHNVCRAMSDQLPTETTPARASRRLTAAEFHRLADVPPEIEWFANLSNVGTRRIYENAVNDFVRFAGIARPEEFRIVTRAFVIAWRDELVRRGLGGSTIRNRLASIASLFEYLCEKNPVTPLWCMCGHRVIAAGV